MSSPLAIGAVTAVLKDLLDNALIDHSVSNAVGPVTVTALAPDRIRSNAGEQAQLNLFLYRVAPNQGWLNNQLPSRNDRGERVTNPPLALDLFYLISAYERNDFEAEILLGYAMQLLHETAVLTRDAIRKTLGPPPPITGGVLPPAFNALTASDLADQIEQIKITLLPLSLDELTKLWSALQTNYRPSAAYHVSVVLIDSKRPARAPLPVLSRGQPNIVSGRDQGVQAQANLLSPYPTLQEVLPPNQQTAVRLSTATTNEVLTLRGYQFAGTSVAARFTHVRTARTLDLPALGGNTATEIQVQLPKDPAAAPPPVPAPQNPDSWLIGFYTVAAVVQRSGEPAPRVTNELPLALAPRLLPPVITAVAAGTLTLTAKCSPRVKQTQTAKLIVGDHELAAEPIAVTQTDTLIFKVKVGVLPSGPQWVRLNVDGVDSLLVDRSGALPVFDTTQQVTIP